MEKKIALIEFSSNHYDFVIATADFIGTRANVEIFIHEDLSPSLKYEYETNYKLLHVPKIHQFTSYIELVKYSFSEFDEIIFLSVTFTWKFIYYLYLIHKIRIPFSTTIHNLNSWLFFGKFNLKNLVRYFPKKYLLKKSKSLIVLNNRLKHNLSNYVSKDILVIPFKIPTCNYQLKKSKKFTIVIPGTVDNKKRDYESIIKILSHVNLDFMVILLGKMNEPGIRSKIIHNKKFKWFDNFVSQEDFDRYLKNCDLILAPTFQKYTWGTSAMEIYGETKASGAEFDCLKYKKRLLINDFYKINSLLKTNNIVYYFFNLEDLKNKLNSLIINKGPDNNIEQIIDSLNLELKHKFISEWN